MVSETGQITIPKGLQDTPGVVPGTILAIHAEEGRLVAGKRDIADPFAAGFRGGFPAGK